MKVSEMTNEELLENVAFLGKDWHEIEAELLRRLNAEPCEHAALKGNRCELCNAPVVFVKASLGPAERQEER